MSSIPLKFPPPPPSFQRVGWRGFLLLLPDEWNLRLHDGNDKKGAVAFSDLRHTRLEVRWQSPKNPQSLLTRLLRRAKSTRSDTTLIASPTRLYELHFPDPAPTPALASQITDDFRQTLPLLADHPDCLWQLYGISAWLPRSAQLQKASLLPGQTTLTFTDGSATVTLASLSLADRHLHHRSLKQWARQAHPTLANHPKAQWQESSMEATLTLQTRSLLRKTNHRLTLTHDPKSNRLNYTLHKTR